MPSMPVNYNNLNAADFGIPTATRKDFTFVSAGASNDDLVATITYRNPSGTIVGVLAFSYVGSTNNIVSITRTDLS